MSRPPARRSMCLFFELRKTSAGGTPRRPQTRPRGARQAHARAARKGRQRAPNVSTDTKIDNVLLMICQEYLRGLARKRVAAAHAAPLRARRQSCLFFANSSIAPCSCSLTSACATRREVHVLASPDVPLCAARLYPFYECCPSESGVRGVHAHASEAKWNGNSTPGQSFICCVLFCCVCVQRTRTQTDVSGTQAYSRASSDTQESRFPCVASLSLSLSLLSCCCCCCCLFFVCLHLLCKRKPKS